MAWQLFPEPQTTQQTGLFCPGNPLPFQNFLVGPLGLQGNAGPQSPGPNPVSLVVEMKGKRIILHYFLKVEQRPLLPWLCFEPRISEIENLKTNGVITIENLLFYKAHAYDLLGWVGFLPFPWTVLCFCSYGNSKQFAHPLLWS